MRTRTSDFAARDYAAVGTDYLAVIEPDRLDDLNTCPQERYEVWHWNNDNILICNVVHVYYNHPGIIVPQEDIIRDITLIWNGHTSSVKLIQ